MGVLTRKQGDEVVFTGIGKLSIIAFLVAISSSLVDTIWAVYIDSFVHSEAIVGLISAGLTLVAFFSFFFFTPIIEKNSKSKIFSYSLLMFGITYALFAINSNFYFFVILAFIMTILYTLKITSFGIIIKDKSPNKVLSRNEGIRYTFMNLAWVIGPLIAGYVSDKYGISKVFVLGSLFAFLSLLFFKVSSIRDLNVKKKVETKVWKNFKEFFVNKDRRTAYVLGGGIALWWSFIYLFIPLEIIRHGLSNMWIGYFLFGVAIPLIFLEYYFSKLAGKIGSKKMFKLGFLIISVFSFACFFASNIYVIMLLLILASLGAAMLEPTVEAYFFDVVRDDKECRFYGPYNTSLDVYHFIGRFSSALVLFILPFKFLFLLFGIYMFALFLYAFKARNVIESREKNKRKK